MAAPLRDLEPRRDVKGGSPRTPSGGIPVADYQQYAMANGNGNGNGIWRAIATGFGGLIVGLLLAWFTALQNKGVTQKEMQDYEEKYSPYMQQREILAQNNRIQDQQIGSLQGVQQHNSDKLSAHDAKFHEDERDIVELQNKMKLVADYIEGMRNPKK